MKMKFPITYEMIGKLNAGDEVLYSGTIYTARDQAHKRLVEAVKLGEFLPVDLKDSVIYYCGPTQTPQGKVIGSCGPTTSRRMDEFTPQLLKAGLKVMIGKGNRSDEVVAMIKKQKAVYFLAYAGCGALISGFVKKCRAVAYLDLGPEAIYKLEVEDLPLIVGIDPRGNNIFNKKK